MQEPAPVKETTPAEMEQAPPVEAPSMVKATVRLAVSVAVGV